MSISRRSENNLVNSTRQTPTRIRKIIEMRRNPWHSEWYEQSITCNDTKRYYWTVLFYESANYRKLDQWKLNAQYVIEKTR